MAGKTTFDVFPPYNVSMISVALLLMPDTRLFDLAVVDETWAPLRLSSEPLPLTLKRCSNQQQVQLSDGSTAFAEEDLTWAERADVVLVPGRGAPLAGTETVFVECIQRAYAKGATVASLCSGAFTLAATGLLEGRRATTHWALAPELAKRHPEITVDSSVLFVGGDRIWTSAGVAAGIDLSVELMRNLLGAKTATMVSRSMVMAPHRAGGQAQFMRTPVAAREHYGAVVEVVSAAVQNSPARQWKNSELARECCMSERSFLRRFHDEAGTSPKQWLIHWRINEACRRLEETDETVAAIAKSVGYETPVAFRQRFQALKSLSPVQYRAAFRTEIRS